VHEVLAAGRPLPRSVRLNLARLLVDDGADDGSDAPP
jgi:hypothetical protein